LPSPEQVEYAGLLVRKAENDARACRSLAADPSISDDVIGFHAQQSVEKALKSALVLRGVDFPRTHDLEFLVELAEESDVLVPPSIRAADWLTPWAAELRYDEPSSALARDEAVAAADAAAAWARSELAAGS
jgi:HEPN domain-containing protein